MTRDDLSQIYFINKEIKMWEQELEKAKVKAEVKVKVLTGMPFANTNETSDPTFDSAAHINDIEMIILGKRKELEIKRKEIITFILNIEDSNIRMIVKYRCVDCMKWEEVAQEVGGTADKVRKTFIRFCRAQDEIKN